MLKEVYQISQYIDNKYEFVFKQLDSQILATGEHEILWKFYENFWIIV